MFNAAKSRAEPGQCERRARPSAPQGHSVPVSPRLEPPRARSDSRVPITTAPHSHLRHGLGQVGGDGRQPLAPTVHDAVAAGAHGRAGARGQAAELGTCPLRLSWGGGSKGACKGLGQEGGTSPRKGVWWHGATGAQGPDPIQRARSPEGTDLHPLVTVTGCGCPRGVPTPGMELVVHC